jgi:hypothetical protein
MSTNTDEKKDKTDAFIENEAGPESGTNAAAIHQQPITMAPNGKPFQNKKAADAFIKKNELDKVLFEAFKHQGGYCVFNLTGFPTEIIETFRAAEKALATVAPSGPPPMTYEFVMFQAKGNPNDNDQVPLSLNGTTMILQREVKVCLPESFLEVADHTIKKQWEQKPGRKRKVVGNIRPYIYQRLGKATLAEFEEFKKNGNAIRDQEFELKARSGDRND